MKADLWISFSLLLLTFAVAVLYLYRVLSIGRVSSKRVEAQGSSALLSKDLMEMTYWAMTPIGSSLSKIGLSPNAISFLSLIFGFLAALALAQGAFGLAGLFTLMASLLDSIDGMVARMSGVASDSGEVLDAAVDRYVEFFFFAGLLVFFRENLFMMMLILLSLLGSFMVSYSTAKAEALQVTPPRGAMRRTERALYMTLAAVFTPFTVSQFEGQSWFWVYSPVWMALSLIAIFGNISAIKRLYAIAQAVKK